MSEDNTPQPRRWYQALGPGIITACVVIGPGSILTSSQVGASEKYSMGWVVLLSVVCMMFFLGMGVKIGVASGCTAGTLVTRHAGKGLALLIGIGVFFISAAFQFGNNLGVHSAFKEYFSFDYMIVIFNALSFFFLFGFKNLYHALERLMMVFVGLMLLAFAVNLFFAKPDVVAVARGFIPLNLGELGSKFFTLPVCGLAGTTFVITAAFFQSYLVNQKGIKEEDMNESLIDSRVGAAIMALITLMIVTTAAAQLKASPGTVSDVARGLEPLFGGIGKPLFCLGLFCAAYSSFLVNSMIGGFILSDCLGLGSKPEDKWPKYLTAAVLLTGMFVALAVIELGINPVPAVVAAQAVTVIASPLIAGVVLWLANRKDIMKQHSNGTVANVFGGIGFVLILAIAWFLVSVVIPKKIDDYKKSKNLPSIEEKSNDADGKAGK
jgi:Mn2+/Fe2+ NRAMP family transporter